MTVRVRLFAGAAEALGQDEVTLADVTTLGDLVSRLVADFGAGVAPVLERCSFLVEGVRASDAETRVAGTVDVLPPFAGG